MESSFSASSLEWVGLAQLACAASVDSFFYLPESALEAFLPVLPDELIFIFLTVILLFDAAE